MHDQSEQRRKLIEHLESAMQLADEMGQPVTAYLIERALDEARAAAWGLR
jgi:DNA-binding ferritin-like protein